MEKTESINRSLLAKEYQDNLHKIKEEQLHRIEKHIFGYTSAQTRAFVDKLIDLKENDESIVQCGVRCREELEPLFVAALQVEQSDIALIKQYVQCKYMVDDKKIKEPMLKKIALQIKEPDKCPAIISSKNPDRKRIQKRLRIVGIILGLVLLLCAVVTAVWQIREQKKQEAEQLMRDEARNTVIASLTDFTDMMQSRQEKTENEVHYIVYAEGFREDRPELVLFEVPVGEAPVFHWNTHVVMDNTDNYIEPQKYYMELNKEWILFEEGYFRVSDFASEIIASDIPVQKEGKEYPVPDILAGK